MVFHPHVHFIVPAGAVSDDCSKWSETPENFLFPETVTSKIYRQKFREAVEVDTLIDGWPFRYVDTAGIRNKIVGDIEFQGIALSRREASQFDVLCLVFDGETDTAKWREQLKIANLPRNTLLVRNKSDLKSEQISVQSMFRHNSVIGALPTVNISALKGEGLPELLKWIKLAVVPQEPAAETTLPLCSI